MPVKVHKKQSDPEPEPATEPKPVTDVAPSTAKPTPEHAEVSIEQPHIEKQKKDEPKHDDEPQKPKKRTAFDVVKRR